MSKLDQLFAAYCRAHDMARLVCGTGRRLSSVDTRKRCTDIAAAYQRRRRVGQQR